MKITQSILSWRSFTNKNIQSPLHSRAWVFLLSAAAILTLLLSTASSSFAGSATWKASPATGDWNTTGNWTAGGPPNGTTDTATFATSNKTAVSLSASTEVNGIAFNSGASDFTITASPTFILTISGAGITNNSGITQNFVTAVDGADNFGVIAFTNSATAGSGTAFTNNGGAVSGAVGGETFFDGSSTAGNGTFTNNGGAISGVFGGDTIFDLSSTADNGTFTTNGGTVSGAFGGEMVFFGTSTAGNGTFTTNGGAVGGAGAGFMEFLQTSSAGNGTFTNNGGTVSGAEGGAVLFGSSFASNVTAGNATLIANGGLNGGTGGTIQFQGVSTGGTARVEVFGNGTGDSTNGNLDISSHNAPGVTIGSIEGNGAVFLGANKLTVGSNNLSETFSGVIQDGGMGGGTGGSLTKIGTGTLTLSGANTYTGGTTISRGMLLVKTKPASGTGSGNVKVNVGTLGGTGIISGAVTVGKGSGSGALLSPGINGPGTLTMKKTLTFKLDGTYKCELKSSNATADKVVAKGVTINSGALFSFVGLGSSALTQGTVFTVINNTATTAIAGTFSNLANGSVFSSNGNNFQASYTGGTGNDLTLTVVP